MTAGPSLSGIDLVVLAGGLGTRIKPVLGQTPKALADIDGQPFLSRLLTFFAAQGVGRIVLALGHGAGQVMASFRDCPPAGPALEFSVEPRPLGTAGAVRHALDLLRGDPVLVANGDSFVPVDLAAFLDFHHRTGAAASLVLAHVDPADRYGRVDVDEAGKICRFREKAAGQTAPGWINAGIYAFDRNILAGLPAKTELSLEHDVFPGLVGGGLHGFRADGPFIDIGTPDALAQASGFFNRMNKDPVKTP